MESAMRFTKMQGAGNDYVYVDCFHESMPHDPARMSRVISDRHFGVGSDGLILICPSDKADARMRMFNADGAADGLVLGVGPQIEHHEAFPRRTNVEFVRVNGPEDVTVRVWERGSGETLACGTGACAVAVAGTLTGRTKRRITAHLPGGDLRLAWSETDNHVYLTGPAVEVFHGEWPEA